MNDQTDAALPGIVPDEVLARLKEAVGPGGWSDDADELAAHVIDERRLFEGATPLLLKPANTAEVSALVTICAESGTPIVPQGGNTGLMGGSVPHDDGSEVLISLRRLDRIREIDTVGNTISVEAGCILADIQAAAVEADRLFPLSLAAEGSCRIGGNLSTNAGGVAVLKYGNTRDLTLGLEVVLPDGRIWDGMRGLRKDNTGYDLKQLFIGAEGTLGIITAAICKLYPLPRSWVTAFIAVTDVAAGLELLARVRAATGDAVNAFEVLPRDCLDIVLQHGHGHRDPLTEIHDWYVLAEFEAGGDAGLSQDLLTGVLAQATEDGLVADAAIASSEAQRRALWALRESLPEAQKPAGASIKHDVSLPLARIPDFIARAEAATAQAVPGSRSLAFGHLGDGNVHYNVMQPPSARPEEFLEQWPTISRLVHDIAVELGGSISAEHGIGRLKRDDLGHYATAVELDLMRSLKQALDPQGIMNPGKVI